jgi:hypothetical protein
MPLFQYFGRVGGFLIAALLAANWCCSAPISPAPRSDVPLDQKINAWFSTRRVRRWRVKRQLTPRLTLAEAKRPAQAERQLSTRSPRWLSTSGLVFDHPAPLAKLRNGTRR